MWSQLIWLDPANWSGTPLASPDAPVPAQTRSEPHPANTIDAFSSHSSDEDDDNDKGSGHGHVEPTGDNEYDFLDEINEESDTDAAFAQDAWQEHGDEEGTDGVEDDVNRIQGSWDIISYLPAAASVYLRHTIGLPLVTLSTLSHHHPI
jgi:hypothetical protein